jgi:hypothetical protein
MSNLNDRDWCNFLQFIAETCEMEASASSFRVDLPLSGPQATPKPGIDIWGTRGEVDHPSDYQP